MVPIPTLLLVVSISKRLFTLNAVADDPRVKSTAPEVEVKFNAPVVKVKPFDAVRSPAEVIVPVPEVAMLPDEASPPVPRDTASFAVDVERVVPVLDQ